MASIRFVDVPYEEKDGLPQLFKLDPSTYGRIPANLLDEAVWFYNYPVEGHYAATTDWSTFSKNSINEAIPTLHEVFKESIFQMVRNLYSTIPYHIDQKSCKNFRGWHCELGAMCAKLLVSSECRNSKKVENLREKTSNVHFREFEKLIPSLGLLETWIESVERIYSERYATRIGVAESEIRQALFEPAWGGSWIIKPNKYIWKIRDRAWNSEKPIYPYGPREVGPTEKLYFSLSSDIFKKLHNVPSHYSKGHLSRTKDVFLQRVYGQTRIISQIIPSYNPSDKRIVIWKKWLRNLEHLAYLFEKALEIKISDGKSPIVWLEIKKGEYVSWIKVDGCGIRIGLSAALGLIGILYAYIADLMARTLMSALSNTIIDIYEEINGYAAIGLYEALSGYGAAAPVGSGTVLDKELIGVLRQWRSFPVGEAQDRSKTWESAEIEKSTRACFRQLLNKPLINEDRWKRTRVFKKQRTNIGKRLEFKDFHQNYVPRFPVITKDFYGNLSLPAGQIHDAKGFNIDNWFADESLYGATFESQIHLFVAFQLLEKSKEILKWNWDGKAYRFKEGNPQKDKKALKKKRYPCFFITAGSFVFGGRKPPHMTHRHGLNFDFVIGPDLISWPVAEISDYIVTCKANNNKDCREWLKSFSETSKRKRFLMKTWRPRAHVICYTKEQENEEEAQTGNRPLMVFRPLVRDEMLTTFIGEIRSFCARKNNTTPCYSEKEKHTYEKAEQMFAGTPHFIGDKDADTLKLRAEERTELADWQRTHAGHLAILLSAAKLIVYGSPIVHFRALHAIRQALKEEGLFFFEFEYTEEHINYLNDSEVLEYQPPESLCEIFFSGGIPIAPAHHIEIISSDEWLLRNYEKEFRLLRKNDCIRVCCLISHTLVGHFSTLIDFTNFSFMPDNHHHHWHVDYGANQLDLFKPLWLSMGVNLGGLRDYLSAYKLNQNKLLAPVFAELHKMRTWCDNYVEAYARMYGEGESPGNEQQVQNKTISNRLMENIFGVFKEHDSPFIKPAVIFEKGSQGNQSKVQAKTSEELKERIKFSGKLLFGRDALVQQLFIRGIIQDPTYLKWSVNFVREQAPLDIEHLLEEGYEEPELEDYEPTTE